MVGLFSPLFARLRSPIYYVGAEASPHSLALSLSVSHPPLYVAVYSPAVRSLEACVQKLKVFLLNS